ncbi:malonic semialdehyde reductase [Novilysobacter antarcticus]|uniref:malonic semialdehyde reductase n=1 Tax=Novilysobacter antarcticus TaxID=2862543 RepID=UPI001C9927A5
MAQTRPEPLAPATLDQLFRTARTHNELGGEVSDDTLRQLYDLVKWGPTSANMSPARFVFVKSAQAKALLEPALDEGNHAKTMAAPVTVIVGFDEDFHEKLPYLFPHTDAKSWFVGPREGRSAAAFRNGSLQGAYLILAARALGLDTGPMSGFDNAKVDAAFFAGTAVKSNFLVNLGYGNAEKIFPRSPRLSFEEAARIA